MCTHAQCLDRESRKGNPPLPSVTLLRLEQQREVIGHLAFSANLPNLFAEGKQLGEAFPSWLDNLRQVVL